MTRLHCFISLKNKGHNVKCNFTIYFRFNKIMKGLELVFSLQDWNKSMLEMFVIQNNSICPGFILVAPYIANK